MNNMMIHMSHDIWREVGYASKLETLVCGVPAIIWAAGSAEGTIRTVVEVVKIPFAALTGYSTEKYRVQAKNELMITAGCFLLTGMSLIPLIFKTIPYLRMIRMIAYIFTIKSSMEIVTQTFNYKQFTDAVERARIGIVATQANELANRISENSEGENYSELLHLLDAQYGKGGAIVTQGDLDVSARQLRGTMIYRNWSYTISYFAIKNSASFVLNNMIPFVMNQIRNEVIYTVNIPNLPKQKEV